MTDTQPSGAESALDLDPATIVTDVLDLFRASGFEVREGAGFCAVVGSIDAAGVLVESVLDHCDALARRATAPHAGPTPVDVRAAFEQTEKGSDLSKAFAFGSDGEYANPAVQNRWIGYQRAFSAQPVEAGSAVQAEPMFNIIPSLTNQQEEAAKRGFCPVCKTYELNTVNRAEGMHFLQCIRCKDIVVLADKRAAHPAHPAEPVVTDRAVGFPMYFTREQWGHITDGLILEIARSEKRKAANSESNSDERAEQCRGILSAINAKSRGVPAVGGALVASTDLMGMVDQYASKRALQSFLEATRAATDRKDRGPRTSEHAAQNAADKLRRKIVEAIAAPATGALVAGDEPLWIQLGQGKIEVGQGHHGPNGERLPAILFGRNGAGAVGIETEGDRAMKPGECIAAITFENPESLDVVAEKLAELRARIWPDAAPAGALVAKFSPTEQQFLEWCDRHDLHAHHNRCAFDDAASLYLEAESATAPAEHPTPCRNRLIENGSQAIPKSCQRCGLNKYCADTALPQRTILTGKAEQGEKS